MNRPRRRRLLRAAGRLFVAMRPGGGLWPTAALAIEVADAPDRLFSVGRDRDGEIYGLGTGRGGGGVHRLAPVG